MRVDVQRVLVHGEETEPSVVGFGDGTPGPVFEGLTGLELFEVAAEPHG
jgi:hypothetical protein